ncbi:uncharacterized protein LOC132742205 [Ruditapes philippinarum]|uniref:uncharacterized protein LOC132742205 n=1 Tax=Ruditapes philippinarum TaxID=129788 RepID=UPI00295C0321|nr:uncharacterized protein LOC132742205 [Ruditapes philippinarum]
MILEKVVINFLVHVLSSYVESALSDSSSHVKVADQGLPSINFNGTSIVRNNKGNSSLDFNEFQNVTGNALDNEIRNYTDVQSTDTIFITTPNSIIKNDSLDKALIDKNISETANDNQIFSIINTSIESSNYNKVTTQFSFKKENQNEHKAEKKPESKAKELKPHNVPYKLHDRKGSVQTFTLSRSKMQLQHHLQLAPMEDAPFGTMMAQEKRYLVTVLVPIGVGIIGAALIVCTILTLRKIARQRSLQVPIDDTEVQRSITPSVSSIHTEDNDKVFLLFGDEEI